MLPITVDKAGWQVAAHRHTPVGVKPDISDCDQWPWQPASIPFDAISWLVQTGQSPDPVISFNDCNLAWVEDVDWALRKSFTLPGGFKNADDETFLVLDQLDCFFDAYLNGKHIGNGQNQFREHLLDVDENLFEVENELVIYIRSARNVTTVMESAYGQLPAAFDNGRVHARRCQSITGWDWTPRLSSVALLKAPELRANSAVQLLSAHIYTVAIPSVVPGQATVDNAQLHLSLDMNCRRRSSGTLLIQIVEADTGNVVLEQNETLDLKAKAVTINRTLNVAQANLWWPLGMGAQPLYTLNVTINVKDKLGYDHALGKSATFGVRTANIDRQKDLEGETFTPHINGVSIFCRGANWIPTHILPSAISQHDTRLLLCAAAGAGMNCLRVWGGGTYESDDFYDCCDQLGILVWQEFMFSCAAYPTYRQFLDDVEAEAEYQVVRLRNHPSILLWCGNNENEWLHQTGDLRKGNEQKIIGETIWSHLIKQVTEEKDPSRYYHQSSPFGKTKSDLNEMTSGDRHSWDAWAHWQSSDVLLQDTGRFITEFGCQALPSMDTIKQFAPHADSINHPELIQHQKMVEGQERIVRYVMAQFDTPSNLSDWVDLSQKTQAEILRRAVENWRRRRFKTSGTLIWQLHDAYSSISWSLIDYYRRPKLGYLAARRFFSPILLSMQILIDEVEVATVPPEYWSGKLVDETIPIILAGGEKVACVKGSPAIQVRFHLVNDTCHNLSGELFVEFVSSDSEPIVLDSTTVHVEQNGSTHALSHEIGKTLLKEIRKLTISAHWQPDETSESHIVNITKSVSYTQNRILGDFDKENWEFDAKAGLSLKQQLIEPKYELS